MLSRSFPTWQTWRVCRALRESRSAVLQAPVLDHHIAIWLAAVLTCALHLIDSYKALVTRDSQKARNLLHSEAFG